MTLHDSPARKSQTLIVLIALPLFVEKTDHSDSLLAAVIVLSVVAGVAIIAAVILLILLIKQRADIKRSYRSPT